MRKDLGNKMNFLSLPVLMIGTYDKDGKANVMNAAWGGIYDYGKIYISLSKHKTTENLELKKAFTVGFATKKTEEISDYFGVVSGNKEDKIAKSGVHVTKSNFVDAPIIEEYIDENGNIDVDKMEIITFDMVSNTYRVLGEVVGNAFKDGLKLKD